MNHYKITHSMYESHVCNTFKNPLLPVNGAVVAVVTAIAAHDGIAVITKVGKADKPTGGTAGTYRHYSDHVGSCKQIGVGKGVVRWLLATGATLQVWCFVAYSGSCLTLT
jgi:hypothetical protein